MPFPIKPVHQLDEHNETFGYKDENKNEMRSDISALQMMFMDNTREAAAKPRYSESTLNTLEDIYNSVDKITSLATEYANPHREASVMYSVPTSVTDNDLLGLKTAGLVIGMGRSVKLTEAGKVALRDKWLGEPNNFVVNRMKEKFDYKNASSHSKFKKVTAEDVNE